LKEGKQELEKAFAGAKLKPALAGPATKLPQTPNRGLPKAVFSKKTGTGGTGKPAPKPEPPKPQRVVNTPKDCDKYIGTKVSSGICDRTSTRFHGQTLYKVTKNDGILKKGDYIYKDKTHHEIELMKSDMKTHRGAIDPKTGKIYKEGVPGRNIKGLK
jgi:hypothetical protein